MNEAVKKAFTHIADNLAKNHGDFRFGLLNKQAGFIRTNRTQLMKVLRELRNDVNKLEATDFTAEKTATFEQYLQPNQANAASVLQGIMKSSSKVPIPGSTKQDQITYVVERLFYDKMKPWRALDNIQQYNHIKTTSNTTFKIMDIANPTEWFPEARKLKRRIIMHVGPTNSGKTYNALKKLETCNTGYYAGPLRLLAREVYDKFQQKRIRCNLLTGEEVEPDIDEFGNISGLTSGTVEMISLNEAYDVVVLDEIQMISDPRRGWAWTNVVLGCQAKELHLCGEVSAVPLIKQIVEMTGDELEVNTYNRLGKLEVNEFPITQLGDFRKGDCIIAFSKKKILDIKAFLENKTNLRCGVVYGALPPETRTSEANKFNNGDYDVLVASDAVGMGLNLSIRRIVFTDLTKFDGFKIADLTNSAIKQIGGRAGRYGVPSAADDSVNGESKGYITAIDTSKLEVVERNMRGPTEYLSQAALWIPNSLWMKYFSAFPAGTKVSDIYARFEKDLEELKQKMKTMGQKSIFFMCDIDTRKEIAQFFDVFKLLKDFLIVDQLNLLNAPFQLYFQKDQRRLTEFDTRSDLHTEKMVEVVKKRISKSIIDFPNLLNLYNTDKGQYMQNYNIRSNDHYAMQLLNLRRLEVLHQQVMLYLWLSYRYPRNYIDHESVAQLKTLTETKINIELDQLRNDRLKKNEFMFD